MTPELQDLVAQRLQRHFGVTLRPLAPVDEGDWCEFCHKPEAVVEDPETSHRFCNATCAEEYASAENEALEQRNLSRYYGGD